MRVPRPGVRPAPPGLPAHVATTRHLCAAYPLVAEAGLGHEGVLIGRDVLGGSFVYDPFALYRSGVVTNPNMVVIGQIGRGKSSFVKSYLWRQAVFGRERVGHRPEGGVRTAVRGMGRGPGGAPSRRTGPAQPARHRRGRRRTAVRSRESDGGRRRRPSADLAHGVAGRVLPRPGPPAPGAGRRRRRARPPPPGRPTAGPGRVRRPPSPRWSTPCSNPTPRRPPRCGRPGPSWSRTGATWPSSSAAWSTAICAGCSTGRPPAASGSTARWWCSTCPPSTTRRPSVSSWPVRRRGCRARSRPRHRNRILLVVDEAWAILGNLGVARWLQSSWKLSRALGVANIAVLHRLSDLASVGAAGLRAGRPGRRAAGRLGDPGRLRPVAGRGGPVPASSWA